MKKTFFLFIAILSLLFINSCRSDGDWGDNQTNGQFGFSIERDKDFQEKAVGETTDIKFNIKANYDFSTVPMVIKYSGDLNGVLKLGDITLEQNKEYELKSANNILKYTGNEAGTHKLKISAKNAKDQSQTEEFELKYGVSDFQIKLEGGNGDFYQGQEISYVGKITPAKNTDTKGYSIKFNSFDGKIKFEGANVELGKEYPINDISNFSISTLSTKIGQSKLSYTIKNTTVSRDLDIQQNILARTVSFDGDASISKNVLEPNQRFSLQAVVKKNPKVSGDLFYKTWVSGQNVIADGITTTNGTYQQYALGDNNQLKLDLQALKTGDYTLNIQLKDEFGNESDVKQFQIKVDNPIKINSGSVVLLVDKHKGTYQNFDTSWISYKGAKISVNANTGAGNKISKIVVETYFQFRDWAETKHSYTIDYNDFPEKVDEKDRQIDDDQSLDKNNRNNDDVKSGRYVIFVYDTQGRYEKIEGSALIQTQNK